MPRNQHRPFGKQKVWPNWKLKLPVRDLLAERYYFKQFEDVIVNGQARTIEEVTRSYKPGRSYNLAIAYSF